jgi:DNA repair exonuclease SbcCD ATPase subunit
MSKHWKERANKAEDESEALRRRVEHLERAWKLHEELQTRFDELQTQMDERQHEHERVLALVAGIQKLTSAALVPNGEGVSV